MTPDKQEAQNPSVETRRDFLTGPLRHLQKACSISEAVQNAGMERSRWEKALAAQMTRGRFLQGVGVAAAALGTMSLGLWEHLHIAAVAAQSGGWIIQDLDYERGNGSQSFPWLPAREGYGPSSEFDKAELIYRGWAPPIPVATYLEQFANAEMNSVPNGSFWVGDCQSASIASGDCPYIQGDKEAFGVVMPWWERMQLAVWHYRYTKRVNMWQGPLTSADFQAIQDRYAEVQRNNEGLIFIVNTSSFRGFSGQEWWGLLDRFEGNKLVMVDFLEWKDLESGQPMRKGFGPVPYNQVTSVKLMDPNQPEPGQEAGFKNTVNRLVAKVFLDKATANPL